MGLRLRKSFGSKNFRVTISKSGVSYSAGCKGFRVTQKANGGTRTTVSIPNTGVSYVEETNPTSKTAKTNTGDIIQFVFWVIIAILTLIFCFCLIVSSCQTTNHNKWIEEERAKHNYSTDFGFVKMPTMIYEYSSNKNGYRCVLQGTVKNQSGYDSAGATFIFGFYDGSGNLLGTGQDFIMSFKNETNRDFKIYSDFFTEKATTAHIINVEYSLSIT